MTKLFILVAIASLFYLIHAESQPDCLAGLVTKSSKEPNSDLWIVPEVKDGTQEGNGDLNFENDRSGEGNKWKRVRVSFLLNSNELFRVRQLTVKFKDMRKVKAQVRNGNEVQKEATKELPGNGDVNLDITDKPGTKIVVEGRCLQSVEDCSFKIVTMNLCPECGKDTGIKKKDFDDDERNGTKKGDVYKSYTQDENSMYDNRVRVAFKPKHVQKFRLTALKVRFDYSARGKRVSVYKNQFDHKDHEIKKLNSTVIDIVKFLNIQFDKHITKVAVEARCADTEPCGFKIMALRGCKVE